MRTTLLAILGVTALPLFALATALATSGCLCTSDQACWPSPDTFATLARQVSQPLVYPRPTAAGCYPPSDPSGNCTDIAANWGNGTWRATHPGSMELANWEAFAFENGTLETCYLDMSVAGTCGQGRVPVIGVDARSVGDVQAAVAFAVAHGLKLVVKNTGHDFIGRSAGRGAFVVWTHHMKNRTYDAAFVPQGAPANETYEALTIGAGVQWVEAYAEANTHGRMMVGGMSVGGSVGAAGGWLLGGGHSFMSPVYGLGVDNALEISVVLSTGEYLVTNAYQNADLFWALRGGGPSTYGIVTSVTYRTYPQTPVQIWSFNATATNASAMSALIEGFLRYTPALTDAGWGGYGAVSTQGVSFTYLAPNMTNDTVPVSIAGFVNHTASLPGVVSQSATYYDPSWYDVISLVEFANGSENGGYVLVSNRLLSRASVLNNTAQVAQLVIECTSGFNTVGGGKVNAIDPDTTGLNPAWRRAVIETTCGASWDETTSPADIRVMLAQMRKQIQAISDATPDDGAYLNEGKASPFEVDWQRTFFGAHYPRLKEIKDKYDPLRLFVVTEGVGSEEWNKNLTCRY